MKPHAFVAMPFGIKKDNQGNLIDFNRIYSELIQPALRTAGLQPLRADEEHRTGDIRTDMFQELLLADLVIADITLDNPNVWYELGIRHGLRARGVVLICGGEISTAFDLYTDRKLRYHIKAEGPDPLLVGADIQNLTEMVKATMQSWHGRKTSPVYQLLPHLQEPDWKSLRIGGIQEYWEKYQAWENRIKLAVNAGYLGDVLVLADEAPVAALRAEAWIKAGKALRQHEHFHFALDQLERGLAIEPDNLLGLHEKGICLQRLAQRNESGYSLDRARTHYQSILSQENYKHDPETWALLGRIDKDAWYSTWNQPNQTTQSYRDEAAYQSPLLKNAIESYRTAYRFNPGHYYSGINALTLMYLYEDLTHDTRYHPEMSAMAGAIRFAAYVETETHPSFWPQATLGDLEILVGTPETVKAAYKEAIADNDNQDFTLHSSLQQLQLLNQLNFHPENVAAGIETFERALQRLTKLKTDQEVPRQVFLFSGHMIDAPNRPTPRFPAEKEASAAQHIATALKNLGAGPQDWALTQGACGGDLLFTEACQQLGVKVQWLQPFDEPEFIQKSVVCHSEAWRSRYLTAKAKLAFEIRAAPQALGAIPTDSDPYERCNLWLLYTALAQGIQKVQFICLWDGGGGDGPGGTAHMYHEVKRRTGQVTRIDTHAL
ncbi:MAG: DUF4071 domain-containing protein [Nitrosomonas sp.]|nr:MAG: DUF4071 domain-containing protein [Nitrosomonas sp.]